MRKLVGLGARIEAALKHRTSQNDGATRASIAEAVGLRARKTPKGYEVQTLTEWIAERADPSVRAAWFLAQECGVRAAWLAFNDGPMFADELEAPADVAARRASRKNDRPGAAKRDATG